MAQIPEHIKGRPGRKKMLGFCGIRLTVRLDDRATENLIDYCKRNKVDASAAIRTLLHRMTKPNPTSGGTRRW